jgi:hypothetical protein
VQPVPVDVPPEVRFVPVPAEHLVEGELTNIPPQVTYGELIQLHILDRSTIDVLNGQLRAIRSLGDVE